MNNAERDEWREAILGPDPTILQRFGYWLTYEIDGITQVLICGAIALILPLPFTAIIEHFTSRSITWLYVVLTSVLLFVYLMYVLYSAPKLSYAPELSKSALEARLRQAIIENDYVLPTQELWDRMLTIAQEIYNHPREPIPAILAPRPDDPAERAVWERWQAAWAKSDTYVIEAIYRSLLAFVSKLPPLTGGPFRTSLISSTPNPANLIWEMKHPFEEEYVKELGLFKWLIDQYNRNVGAISEPGELAMQPQRYTGERERMAAIYFNQIPLLPLLQTSVPYNPFSELNRCAHHWCLGKTRRGKTTFLRHLIKYDLTEVAKGNCSLVVIDSKPLGLVHEMRTLQQFAPHNPLDGKLILIDSDSDYPFPLNPFYLPKEQAKAVLLYMLGNLSNATERQAGALAFYINAVLSSRNKSLQTLLDYMRLGKELPDEIANFDKQTADWFRSTRKTLHGQTSGGIEQRLADFMDKHEHSPLMTMLSADSWGLDLFSELHNGGKVLLVDTNHFKNGADGTALMGRLFIALIENLATCRQKAAKPIWVVIDEASDYLSKNDPAFTQILIKAAGAKVGMTVAYQTKGLIDPDIEKALSNAEIQSFCNQRGTVELVVEERPLPPLPIAQLEFEREPQMRPEDYKYLRQWLAYTYPYKRTPDPPKENSQPLEQKF